LLAPAAPAHVLPGPGEASCGGVAPSSASCATGEHLRPHAADVVLDFAGTASDYRGVLEARLAPLAGEPFLLSCTFGGKGAPSCRTTGALPHALVPFTHECRSLDERTSLAGGSGAWACRLAHGGL
jgi:hypothetical protein